MNWPEPRSTVSLSLAAIVAVGASSPPQPRFRSGTDAVLVDVQVTTGGRPVAGLTANDFELKDNGVRQDIKVVVFTDVPISLLLALDVSSSLKGEALQQLKQAARAAIAALRPDDQGAVLTFAGRIELESAWTTDRALLTAAIDRLEASGRTALFDAIFTCVAVRETARGRMLALVFSDGADTTSWLDPQDVLRAARHTDLVVTAVSPGPLASSPTGRDGRAVIDRLSNRRWFDSDPTLFPYAFLEAVTDETGGEALRVGVDRNLATAFQKIVSDYKTRYLLTYSPKGVASSGWHPLEVKLKNRRADVKARRGYWR